jgi:toxin FitB
MMLVDTDVLSAMMRIAAEPAVERWFDAQSPESIWTTAITVFEIRFGLALLVY